MAGTENLSKVDSAISGVGEGAKPDPGKKRTSSSYPGVMNINDLGELPPAPQQSVSNAALRQHILFLPWSHRHC
jgi:hypothetical protein